MIDDVVHISCIIDQQFQALDFWAIATAVQFFVAKTPLCFLCCYHIPGMLALAVSKIRTSRIADIHLFSLILS